MSTLPTPVFALLVSNMLENPELFAAHWSAFDSATVVFLTCKTLRQLRRMWNESAVSYEAIENANDHFPLLMHLARKRQRTPFVSVNTLLFGAAVRARLADRNAMVIAFTLKTSSLCYFVDVANKWARGAGKRQFMLVVRRSHGDMALKMKGAIYRESAMVRLCVPDEHLIFPNADENCFAAALSHHVCEHFVGVIGQWLKNVESDCLHNSLVLILQKNARGDLHFFEIFDKQSYARVQINGEEQ